MWSNIKSYFICDSLCVNSYNEFETLYELINLKINIMNKPLSHYNSLYRLESVDNQHKIIRTTDLNTMFKSDFIGGLFHFYIKDGNDYVIIHEKDSISCVNLSNGTKFSINNKHNTQWQTIIPSLCFEIFAVETYNPGLQGVRVWEFYKTKDLSLIPCEKWCADMILEGENAYTRNTYPYWISCVDIVFEYVDYHYFIPHKADDDTGDWVSFNVLQQENNHLDNIACLKNIKYRKNIDKITTISFAHDSMYVSNVWRSDQYILYEKINKNKIPPTNYLSELCLESQDLV